MSQVGQGVYLIATHYNARYISHMSLGPNRKSIVIALVASSSIALANAALAQATLQKQALAPIDICAGRDPTGMSAADISTCAQDALWNENWPAFFKWAPIGAAKGDWIAASWLGDVFESRRQPFYSFMWFDIAARLHATEIAAANPSANPNFREDNSSELVRRDNMGKWLSAQDRKNAIAQEKDWVR